MPKALKLVSLEWLDSKGVTEGWEFRDELEPLTPSRCRTVGFIIEETTDYKTVVQTISDTQVLGRITIPRRAILKETKLKS